jgi:hypothetical protein
LVVALLLPLSVIAGCQQGVGDRCQVQSDCQDGLICVLQAGATPQAGGTCEQPSVVGPDMAMTTPADLFGVIQDMSAPVATDMTPAGD